MRTTREREERGDMNDLDRVSKEKHAPVPLIIFQESSYWILTRCGVFVLKTPLAGLRNCYWDF